MYAVTVPLIELPCGVDATTHIDALFSSEGGVRERARRWLEQNADIGSMHAISYRALKLNGSMPAAVRRDVHEVLTSFVATQPADVANAPAEKSATIRTAMCMTVTRRRLCR